MGVFWFTVLLVFRGYDLAYIVSLTRYRLFDEEKGLEFQSCHPVREEVSEWSLPQPGLRTPTEGV